MNARMSSMGVLLLLASACAHAPPVAAPAPSGRDSLTVEVTKWPDSTPKDVTTAKVTYGLGRAAEWAKRQPTTKNHSGDDFAIELAGRRAEIDVWKELHSQDHDDELALLSEVDAAGFLPEVLVLVFARPGWTVPADVLQNLRVDAFWPWAKAHLEGRELERPATTTPKGGKTWPDPPGHALLDPEPLAQSGPPCGEWKNLEHAVDQWSTEAATLDGVPLVAHEPQEFLALLSLVKDDPAFRERGATWVLPRVGLVHFFGGFCAIERQEWSSARRALEAALPMLPGLPNVRFELAHVLLQLKEPEKAVSLLEGALTRTADPCQLAVTLRKLGYARFDQGRFAESADAYERSLQYEPENPLALSELKLLRNAMMKNGVTSPAAAGEYKALPQVVTRCRPRPSN